MWVWGVCVVLIKQCFSTTPPDTTVFPVYPTPNSTSPHYPRNNSIDVVVATMFRTAHSNRRYKDEERQEVSEPSNRINEEEIYLAGVKEACSKNSITSCWTYNVMSLVGTLLKPTSSSISSLSNDGEPSAQLIELPVKSDDVNMTILGRSGYFGFGNLYLYLERQVIRFIATHGIVFPAASSWDDGVFHQFQTPVLFDNETERQMQDAEVHQRKTKKKSILFPLLVLFKFFKIKMILIPILLTVLLVKKLLIATLALAPNLAGFFRVCRPQMGTPFSLAPAGLLQDVSDSRGEFSHLYNSYANPYRDHYGYRNRDLPRYADPPRETTYAPDY